MKLKLFLIASVSAFACSLNACPDNTLSHQYETGALQWQVVRKEIDPNTLIHQAILENASEEIINFLLSHGVNVNYPDENGMSPLTIAILNRSTNAVKVLLEHRANTNPQVKWNEMSLLELCIAMKDSTSANLLVQFGADVNSKNKQGISILSKIIKHANSSSGCDIERSAWVQLAKLMIFKGANIHSCKYGDSPFFEAVKLAYVIKDGSMLALFLDKGADVNMIEMENPDDPRTQMTSLLMEAVFYSCVYNGYDGIIKFFVEAGADVNKTVNYKGQILSPLKHAMTYNQPHIVQYLMQHGARG